MFTGLVETIGTVTEIGQRQNYRTIKIAPDKLFSDLSLGESIAIDGCCLTVIEFGKKEFAVEASPESVSRTIVPDYRGGSRVNLERALLPTGRLGGHFVTGHIDGIGTVSAIKKSGEAFELRVECPSGDRRYIVPKGSIAINGISLTINDINENKLTVNLIPHTRTMTTAGNFKVGDRVNLEFDIIGKYIARFLSQENRNNLTIDKLMDSGW
ncbi:Riboflavin synthase [Candidatus Zixiibacteriota bacterium]|nr:Riboflavin synthase [candidate division Zixibacteria bacterium]